MEETYLQLCDEYLNKLKILLKHKKIEDLKYKELLEMIMEMERSSIKVVNNL